MGTTSTNEPGRPIRRILVRFEAARGCAALRQAADIAHRECATIDICGTVRRRSVLLSLALVGGVAITPETLEAEELAELAEEMRRAVAELPADLGVRSFLLVGNRRRKMAELMAAGDYDLVV
ncbi:MAG: hypothetical protein JST53_07760 [Actinobacteria bacterium]|nr:hypothetical protein [Actinomycetota bacterium]